MPVAATKAINVVTKYVDPHDNTLEVISDCITLADGAVLPLTAPDHQAPAAGRRSGHPADDQAPGPSRRSQRGTPRDQWR